MSETPPEEISVRDSILASTKKNLGLADDYTAFDLDVMLQINSALTDLNDIGIGPPAGFAVEDRSDTWEALLLDVPKLNQVKNLIFLKTRFAFDPPQTSYHISAMQEQIKELMWRLSTRREGESWTAPV